VQLNAYEHGSTADFIALAETRAANLMLSETVFEPWLYEPGKPPPPS
jgi:hypothetical protein